ncbi:transaldolase [Spongiimicrobium sp. 3-5]|uniref:transaldolase n=1 Tax=Spongiimicrobium sp. 3-5 TaxID=3332596 RepID=UPI0039815C18
MNKIAIYLFLFLLASCGEEKKSSPTVYFAGEIVNPTSEYVVLYKDDQILDSAKLNDRNRFKFNLECVTEGLHHFSHQPESQYVYFHEGDSLQIRLNTIDFDESLVFSGVGEEINNFLIEMFLIHEDEEPLMYSSYKLHPDEFTARIDSLRELKMGLLADLIEETELPNKTLEIAKASIDYGCYIYKEKYPFYHKKKTKEKKMHATPEDFYGYRNKLVFNNKDLAYYRPYYNYMRYHFGNLSYMSCAEACGTHEHTLKNHLHFTRHTLALIDSLVKQEDLRDNLFRHVAMDYLLKVNDTKENNKKFIDLFHKLSGNNRHIAEIDGLYEGINRMQPNSELPDVTVYDTEGNAVSIKDIAKKGKVVFYFWWGTQKGHFRNITQKVEELSAANPEYTFIGINFDTDNLRWLSMIESGKLDRTKQYKSDNTKELRRSLIVDHLNKGIITNDGLIADAFANIYTSFKE